MHLLHDLSDVLKKKSLLILKFLSNFLKNLCMWDFKNNFSFSHIGIDILKVLKPFGAQVK